MLRVPAKAGGRLLQGYAVVTAVKSRCKLVNGMCSYKVKQTATQLWATPTHICFSETTHAWLQKRRLSRACLLGLAAEEQEAPLCHH